MVNRKNGVFDYFCNLDSIKIADTLKVKPLGIVNDSILLEVELAPIYNPEFPSVANRKYKIFRNRSKLFIKIKDGTGKLVLFDITDIVRGFLEDFTKKMPVVADVYVCKCGNEISHRFEDSISCCYDMVMNLDGNPYDLCEVVSERTGKLYDNGYDEYYCEKCGAVYTEEEVKRLKTKKYFSIDE